MKYILIFVLALSFAPPSAIAKNGGLLQTGSVSVTTLEDGSGEILSDWITTNLFDIHGNLVSTITLNIFEGEPATGNTNTFFYDHHGNIISAIQDFDYNLDGVVDRRTTVISTTLSNTSRRQISFIDNNADGTNDEIDTSTYTFDNDNRLIGLVTEFDRDADGVADFRSVESWHYDLDNHRLLYTNISDLYTPGVPKVISTATYLLNENGDPISGIWSRYDAVYGSMIVGTSACTYDKFGNLVQQLIVTEISGPSGPTQSIATTDFFYVHRGLAARDLQPDTTTKQLKDSIETVQI